MKISIITSVFNNIQTLEESIMSVLHQSYRNIEQIIIDGGSTDGTIDLLSKYNESSIIVSEPDDGIYHALNKGILLASGDIIGFLHADDFYADNHVIETVVSQMLEHNVDSCYGDLQYVHKDNPEKIIRYWKSCPYEQGSFKKGWMPPHPTFFVRKEIYKKYGMFNTDLKIAADYELMLRLLDVHNISTHYIPRVLVKMRAGGASNKSMKNILRKSYEDYRARKMNNLQGNYYAVFLKNISKIPQFLNR